MDIKYDPAYRSGFRVPVDFFNHNTASVWIGSDTVTKSKPKPKAHPQPIHNRDREGEQSMNPPPPFFPVEPTLSHIFSLSKT
jgi:hypothetical protein